jgi:hypothetical protein
MRARVTTLVAIGTLLGTLAFISTAAGSATTPTVPKCSTGALSMSVGPLDGTVGTFYYPLVFTNDTTKSCTLAGTPNVRADTAINSMGGPLVGRPARVVNNARTGYGRVVVLAPRGHASANYGVVDTGNYPVAMCYPKTAQSVSVSLQGRMYWAKLRFTVCTTTASTTISGVVPGRTGLVSARNAG